MVQNETLVNSLKSMRQFNNGDDDGGPVPNILSNFNKGRFDHSDDDDDMEGGIERRVDIDDDDDDFSDHFPLEEDTTIKQQQNRPFPKQPLTANITNDLMDKFYHETMIEMNIKADPAHSPYDAGEYDRLTTTTTFNKRKNSQKSLEEVNEDEITSKSLLISLKKDLETEIKFVELNLNDLIEQETILTMGNGRLESEIAFNNTLTNEERSNLSDLNELSRIVEVEVDKKESAEQKKIITNLETSEDDSFTNSSIAYNILKLQYQIEETSRKLEEEHSIHNQHLMAKRRRMIEKHHLKEINQQKLNFEKRVSAETKRIEDKHNHDLHKLLEENKKLDGQEQMLESKLEFVINEDGEQIMKTMERVMSMLKGREELPDGNYISVSRAIGYYSQLKEATENGTFSVSLFKKFLREHKEFGFFVFDFEDFYTAAKIEEYHGAAVKPNEAYESTNEPIQQQQQQQKAVLLDPTENLYNNREEIPKFVNEQEKNLPRPTTATLRKKSSNSSMTRSSNNNTSITIPATGSSSTVNNRSLNKSDGNASSAQDVLKRSMGVLSKIKKINK